MSDFTDAPLPPTGYVPAAPGLYYVGSDVPPTISHLTGGGVYLDVEAMPVLERMLLRTHLLYVLHQLDDEQQRRDREKLGFKRESG